MLKLSSLSPEHEAYLSQSRGQGCLPPGEVFRLHDPVFPATRAVLGTESVPCLFLKMMFRVLTVE